MIKKRTPEEVRTYFKGFCAGVEFVVKRLCDQEVFPSGITKMCRDFNAILCGLQREALGLSYVEPKRKIRPPPDGAPDWLHWAIRELKDCVGDVPGIDDAELTYDDWCNQIHNLKLELDRARTELANLHAKHESCP